MKKMRRLVGLVLAMVMVMSMAVSVFADETYTITINNDKTGYEYEAYQIFTGDLHNEANQDSVAGTSAVLSNITWGTDINDAGKTALLSFGKAEGEAAYASAAELAAALNDSNSKAFAAEVVKYLTTTNKTSAYDATAKNYKISGLNPGYYLVKDVAGTVGEGEAYTAYILEVVENSTLNPKADAPGLEKKIVKDGDYTNIEEGNRVDANNGSIGDVVNYELTSKVPAMEGYNKYFFIVHDTLSPGLTFGNDVKVYINGTAIGTDKYDVEVNGQTFKIVFKNFIQHKQLAGKPIVITYSATINKDAVIGNLGNPNEVYLQYSNNPNVDQIGKEGDEDEPANDNVTGTTPKDYVITYLTAIELFKVDDQGNKLTGAEFTLTGTSNIKTNVVKYKFEPTENGTYYKLTDGTYTTTPYSETLSPETKAKYVVNEDAEGNITVTKYSKVKEVTTETTTATKTFTGTVNEDGNIAFEGLGEGTYTIKEIKAPDGYNLLGKDITVEIECTEPTTVTDPETQKATWTYIIKFGGVTVSTEPIVEFDRVSISVENNAGTVLPETGGMGTTLFYVIGATLAIGAAVVMVTRRRMSAN